MFTDPVNLYHARERANDLAHRVIFCTYWLYFYSFRGVLGHIRVLDYLGIALVLLGLIGLVLTMRLDFRLAAWVTALACPLAIATILDPSIYVILYVFKMYVVALYFTLYVKSLRLTLVEFVCFAVPVVVSVYYFLYPRPSEELLLLQGRMSGIDEPNFTSLSLIQAMCGAFGIYMLTELRRAKVIAIAAVFACSFGVVLTGSKGGFIAVTSTLCLFFFVRKRLYYAGGIAVVAAALIALNPGFASQHKPAAVERFRDATGEFDFSGRDRLFELAWDDIHRGKWFIGGGPQRVSEWGKNRSFNVPHNSLLDFGLAFGKGSFYFYGALLAILLAVNVRVVIAHRSYGSHEEKERLLAAVLFLSLFPMYMSLSAGMAMSFVLWMVLGAYPLLHKSAKNAIVSWNKPLYCSASLPGIPAYWDGLGSYAPQDTRCAK